MLFLYFANFFIEASSAITISTVQATELELGIKTGMHSVSLQVISTAN